VAAIQGNVAQDEKWQAASRELILERHLGLTAEAVARGARLVLWPESSTLEQIADSPVLARRLQQVLAAADSRALVGSVYRLPDGGFSNAAFLVHPRLGLVQRYDKQRLVPFGETVPLGRLLFFVRPLVQAVGDFRPGTDPGVMGGADASIPPFGVAICYEIIYPHLVAEQVRAGATFLTTITNDAWFGVSGAPSQHFAMAVMRAAESRRWLLRAANTGISGLVDPGGRVLQATGLFRPALVSGTIRARHELTFFVRHPQAVPLGCVMILVLAVAVAAGRPAGIP
jgi:apolipoprotein N-acyltransferase